MPPDAVDLVQVLTMLARRTGLAEENLPASLRLIAEASARALHVARVNMWELTADGSRLRCIESYEEGGRTHLPGCELLARDYPSYFASLNELRTIAVLDARGDPRTRELCVNYLDRFGITTMLDAPVFVAGRLAGVVCHEHVGPRRAWTEAEQSYAGSIGDLVALCLEVDRRARAERERRALATQLADAQRLESLGLLAGGVVHDFNNILMTLRGRLAMAQAVLPTDSAAIPHLHQVEIAAQHATELCVQLLQQTQPEATPRGGVDLNALVRELLDLVIGTLGPNAQVVNELAPHLPVVQASAPQLRQVVMNLLRNAAEALNPTGGTITVRSWHNEAWPNAMLGLEIADDGCGMNADLQAKLFRPLASTKGPGRGLGLASARAIIRAHGGQLHVVSEPGVGTTFRIDLPATSSAPAGPPPPVPHRPRRTVLVADDDVTTRLLLKDLFEPAGWDVILARDGLEVLETMRVYPSINLVLLDYRMPRLDGRETCEQLRLIAPEIAVVVTTAYSSAAHEFAGLHIAGFMAKPIEPAALFALANRLVPFQG